VEAAEHLLPWHLPLSLFSCAAKALIAGPHALLKAKRA